MSVFQKCVAKASATLSRLVTVIVTLTVSTNKMRWKKVASAGRPPWDARNEKIASFIPPNSSVIDLGCGAQTLKGHLRFGCEYQPCDLVKSSPDVIVCDFNAGLYPKSDKRFTHVVCSGVLEYVRDHRRFLKECSALGDKFILSYNTSLSGDSKFDRMANNWVNHFSRPVLEHVFSEAGLNFECLDMAGDGREAIYMLKAIG